MRKAIFFITSLLCLACQKQESMQELTARVFERAAAQMELMDKNLDSAAVSNPGVAIYPRSINKEGALWTSNYKWWCSGFYPGSMWYVYEYTGDEKIK